MLTRRFPLAEKLRVRFNVGRADTLAYYESLTKFLESRGIRLSDELRRMLDELQALVKAGRK